VEYRNNGDPLKSIEKEVDETCSRAGLWRTITGTL
jgi:hypothetical protein